MRKFLLISFSAFYLLIIADGIELLKIDRLIEHYRFHQLVSPHTGFLQFIAQHYAGDDGIKGDAVADSQLPFCSSHHLYFMPFFLVVITTAIISYFSFYPPTHIYGYRSPYFLRGHQQMVFHPPDQGTMLMNR